MRIPSTKRLAPCPERYAAAVTESATPRLSPANQERLAQLSADERDLVLWAIATYPSLSVAVTIRICCDRA
jgi:hypothetical protein